MKPDSDLSFIPIIFAVIIAVLAVFAAGARWIGSNDLG